MNDYSYNSWPFKEAQKLRKRFREPPAAPVRFETSFGPSGLPHIGTFTRLVGKDKMLALLEAASLRSEARV